MTSSHLVALSGDDAADFSTKTEAAYVAIREGIITGNLAPGAKLKVGDLKERYGFGASSLREALSKLTVDRFVVNKGQRGFWVAPTSRAEFADITTARLLVEPEALRLSVADADAAWREDVTAAYDELYRIEAGLGDNRLESAPLWEQANRAFHTALLSRCASAWMLRFVDMLAEQSERYRRRALILHAVPVERLLAEHKAIHDAALAGHRDLAAEALRVHVQGAADGISRTLFEVEN